MNTKVNTNEKTYTTAEVAQMLAIGYHTLTKYIELHPELKPEKIGKSIIWTAEDISKVCNHRKHGNGNTKKSPLNLSSTPTSTTLAPVTANTTTALVDMFNEFINIEHEEQLNENRAANRKFKFFFERMTEKDLQKFFAPLLERFKYSYVTRHVNNVQSQTLTCIKRGTLKGIKKYELTYAAFLELCKFAADNNCPLELPQVNEEA